MGVTTAFSQKLRSSLVPFIALKITFWLLKVFFANSERSRAGYRWGRYSWWRQDPWWFLDFSFWICWNTSAERICLLWRLPVHMPVLRSKLNWEIRCKSYLYLWRGLLRSQKIKEREFWAFSWGSWSFCEWGLMFSNQTFCFGNQFYPLRHDVSPGFQPASYFTFCRWLVCFGVNVFPLPYFLFYVSWRCDPGG